MGLTYKDSGVDKDAGYQEVALIKNIVKKTHSPQVLSGIGGFGALFKLYTEKYPDPVLVSGTDGVGTKLLIAIETNNHSTIGEDLVAMCVNDVLCQGAKPLFFLDYIACDKLIPEKLAEIVASIAEGCLKADCALIGGETAEMPGMYAKKHYDVAGFCVGVVSKNKIIDGSTIQPGDILFALPSSGLHSNGFSLVRKIVFEKMGFKVNSFNEELGTTLGEELLKPTRIYVHPMLELIEKFSIKGVSHITGGGLYENVPRMLPKNTDAVLDISKVPIPKIFSLLQQWGEVETSEMYNTFNMGIGMVFAAPQDEAEAIADFLRSKNERCYRIGEIASGSGTIRL